LRNLILLLFILWTALLTIQLKELTLAVRYQSAVLQGQQEDLYNLQRQIDGTYEQGPLPTHVDASTPTPLAPRHLHQHVGQVPKEN